MAARAPESVPTAEQSIQDQVGTPASKVCVYFAQGKCMYGESCRYLHTTNSSSVETEEESISSLGENLGNLSLVAASSKFNPNAPVFVPRFALPSSNTENSQSTIKSSSTKIALVNSDLSTSSAVFYPPNYDSSYLPEDNRDHDQYFCDYASDYPDLVPQGSEGQEQCDTNTNGSTADKPISWAHVVNPEAMAEVTIENAESQLCPFAMAGECRHGEYCAYVHGEVCPYCDKAVLHPWHERQQEEHKKKCLKDHETAMEIAFAVAKTKDKTCGICMEVIVEKSPIEARFGIMPNCNHCYCLTCLRQWRQEKQFNNEIIRACPECRITSDYICPSRYWVDTKEEKEKLLQSYRQGMHKKDCKYFKQGSGDCPFGNKCFYRHAKADGTEVDVGPPTSKVRRTVGADGDYGVMEMMLHDFLTARDQLEGLSMEEYLFAVEMMFDDDSDDE